MIQQPCIADSYQPSAKAKSIYQQRDFPSIEYKTTMMSNPPLYTVLWHSVHSSHSNLSPHLFKSLPTPFTGGTAAQQLTGAAAALLSAHFTARTLCLAVLIQVTDYEQGSKDCSNWASQWIRYKVGWLTNHLWPASLLYWLMWSCGYRYGCQ